jgi:PPOX class probable F420-dependent enzyme
MTGLGRCARGLLGIEICGLQWRRRRLTSLLRIFLLAALQSIFHPFTHVQACNTDDGTGAIAEAGCAPETIGAELESDERRYFLCRFRIEPMPSQIPPPLQGQKYISLTTFRKTGKGVATPVWFGEDAGKLYVMTRSDMGKTKRIRNNPQVRIAPCTMRGTVTGAEVAATARILPPEEHARARQAINRKYWAARIPFLWWRTDTYIEISFA